MNTLKLPPPSPRFLGSAQQRGRTQYPSCLAIMILLVFGASPVCPIDVQASEFQSQSDGSPEASQQNVESPQFQLGIDGKFRSGRWTPFWIAAADPDSEYEIQSLDGEAVRFSCRFRVQPERVIDGRYCTYLPVGPPGAPFEVRVATATDNQRSGNGSHRLLNSPPVYRKRLLDGLVTVDRPWVVALGDVLGFDQIGRNDLLGISGSLDVSLVRTRTDLPDQWFGFDGVDLMIISGGSIELLESLTPAQSKALREWTLGGGQLLVSLGTEGPRLLKAAPWLAELLQAGAEVEVFQAEPEGIETFVSAKTPIRAFPAARLSSPGSSTMLAGRNAERQMVPLITLHSIGLGKATVFAGGLEQPPFAGWKQYADLINRMLPDLLSSKRNRRESGAITADVRYEELAGQVRASLDRFVVERGTSFSIIAAIVLVLVGFIGPLDYFLINRWLGRPLLGWISFPITIAAFSAAIIFWSQQAIPTSMNRITVLDMDSQSQFGRAFSWTQIYSHQAEKFDFQYTLSAANLSAEDRRQELLTGPWGYAGSVYGGIEVAGEDVRLPSYRLETVLPVNQSASSKLVGVPMASRSSRAVAGRWTFTGQALPVNDLKRRVGSDLLTGSLVNPFEEDLLDGYLVYRNLAYIMPTRVPAGSRVAAIDSLPTKNFRWRLNRRQTAEESTRSEQWNPASDDNLDRLMEIVMFYKAAGGVKYAGLENRELSHLDLSDVLAMDKAMLVGRLAKSPAELKINGDVLAGENISDLTYVRMVIPITGQEPQRVRGTSENR